MGLRVFRWKKDRNGLHPGALLASGCLLSGPTGETVYSRVTSSLLRSSKIFSCHCHLSSSSRLGGGPPSPLLVLVPGLLPSVTSDSFPVDSGPAAHLLRHCHSACPGRECGLMVRTWLGITHMGHSLRDRTGASEPAIFSAGTEASSAVQVRV